MTSTAIHSLDALFSTRAKTVPEAGSWGDEAEGTISLAYGFADPQHFPVKQLVDATAEILAEDVNGALN